MFLIPVRCGDTLAVQSHDELLYKVCSQTLHNCSRHHMECAPSLQHLKLNGSSVIMYANTIANHVVRLLWQYHWF